MLLEALHGALPKFVCVAVFEGAYGVDIHREPAGHKPDHREYAGHVALGDDALEARRDITEWMNTRFHYHPPIKRADTTATQMIAAAYNVGRTQRRHSDFPIRLLRS